VTFDRFNCGVTIKNYIPMEVIVGVVDQSYTITMCVCAHAHAYACVHNWNLIPILGWELLIITKHLDGVVNLKVLILTTCDIDTWGIINDIKILLIHLSFFINLLVVIGCNGGWSCQQLT